MSQWTLAPQVREGDFHSTDRLYLSEGVLTSLDPDELTFVINDLHTNILNADGLDCFQVYNCDDGRELWCFGHINQSMKATWEFDRQELLDYDYWTLMLPEES